MDGFGDDGGGDDGCEQEDDAPPTTSEKSQHSVTSSCSFTDQANVGTDPSPMNDMMGKLILHCICTIQPDTIDL